MKQRIAYLIVWLRRQLASLTTLGQVVVILAITLISIRIIFPVWHLWDGYVVYLYPLRESALCLAPRADCQVDRSRTAIEAGSIGLLAFGFLLSRKSRE